MGFLLIISTPILFFFLGAGFLLAHHAYTHDGNFFDITDAKLAFASHESILLVLGFFTLGLVLGGVFLN